jgi:hypothetical protein
VIALDRVIEDDLAIGSGNLRRFLTQTKDIPTQLTTPLRGAARQLILRAMQGLNMSRLAEQSGSTAFVDSLEFRRCVEAAKPLLQTEMAASRLLVMVPQHIDQTSILASLAREGSPAATVIRMTQGDLIACQEVEQLHVRRVAAALVDNRRDYIEIANRLHARIDVDWDDMSTNSGSSL